MLKESLVVLDFETSGLHCDLGDRIIEVAALRVEDGQVTERFETLVNCRANIPPHISKFTGITVDMIDGAPSAAQVFPDLLDFIGGDAIVAHNAGFDQGFLESECGRLRLPCRHEDFICSVKLARLLFPEMRTHALGALASSLGLEFTPGAHRAGADALATVGVFLRLAQILRARYPEAAVGAALLRQLQLLPAEQALAKLSSATAQISGIRAA